MASQHGDENGGGEERMQYSSQLELLLTLVGYAVGLGNIWRFPYLTYTYGGGAFLVPYVCALVLLGLPLFVLELGLGQMFRQGTLGIWSKLGLPRFRGVGAAATICTFFVSLYYNVILGWTIYYIGRTLGSLFSGGPMPWTDQVEGFSCPETTLHFSPKYSSSLMFNNETGIYTKAYVDQFWCPTGDQTLADLPSGYLSRTVKPITCPAVAAVQFWATEAMQQSSGMDDLVGFPVGLLISYTLAWILIYICIFKGIASSGKVVYVTATMPYVALIIFFFRAVTLPGAGQGVLFFIKPDFSLLLDANVWIRASTQIFYSLGVGFGSLVAFASYGSKNSDFNCDAFKVALINCGTSIFAGFVVFPILGFLALELSEVNPCIQSVKDLSSIGLQGTGLAFIAFPIAISQMPGGYFWAILFFLMLLCLGIDSQFAMVESVMTVLDDAGLGTLFHKKTGCKLPRPAFAAIICVLSYLLGLVFVTRGGLYWFNLFDYYTCVVALFFVTFLECFGLMWYDSATFPKIWLPTTTYPKFKEQVKEWTGRELGLWLYVSWKFICPALLIILIVFSFMSWDLMGAKESVPYPEGTGFLPEWSIWLGWVFGILPVVGFFVLLLMPVRPEELPEANNMQKGDGVVLGKARDTSGLHGITPAMQDNKVLSAVAPMAGSAAPTSKVKVAPLTKMGPRTVKGGGRQRAQTQEHTIGACFGLMFLCPWRD